MREGWWNGLPAVTPAFPLLPSAGCFGNIFSIVGLAMNKRMPLISSQADNSGSSKQISGHLSFTRLLIALAVADFLYLLFGIAIFGLPVLSQGRRTTLFSTFVTFITFRKRPGFESQL